MNSWRPDLGAQGVPVAESSASSGDTQGDFAAIGLGLAALLACVLLTAPRLPGKVVLSGLLVLTSMLLAGLTSRRELLALAAGPTVHRVPHLSLGGVEAAVALAIIGLLAQALWTRHGRGQVRSTAALSPLVVLGGVAPALGPVV